eukprot:458454-Amorphochlora_amoeboformis.AAC.1
MHTHTHTHTHIPPKSNPPKRNTPPQVPEHARTNGRQKTWLDARIETLSRQAARDVTAVDGEDTAVVANT